MPERNQAALDFLLTRRSRPAKTLAGPWPGRADLDEILTAAARSPDHGKLEPWRFIVLTGIALDRLARLAEARGATLGKDSADIAKAAAQYADSGCAVAVISAPIESEKVPMIEQIYSAGGVCLALLNAALAAGWGASWLTGWPLYDADFLSEGLRLSARESVAGMIHIGTETSAPPDRPRPDLGRITTWVDT